MDYVLEVYSNQTRFLIEFDSAKDMVDFKETKENLLNIPSTRVDYEYVVFLEICYLLYCEFFEESQDGRTLTFWTFKKND